MGLDPECLYKTPIHNDVCVYVCERVHAIQYSVHSPRSQAEFSLIERTMKIRPGIHCRGDSAHACLYLLDVCVKCTVQTCLVVPRKCLGMIYSLLSLCDMVSLLSREPLRSGLAAQRVGRLQMFRGSRLEAHKIAMPSPFMSSKV